jgi:hypothetical protein
MQKEQYIEQIISALAYLSSKVELCGSVNLTNVHVISEDFYKELFNIALGYSLTNMNEEVQNAPAIDLGNSCEPKIAFQITSTSSIAKTRKTVNQFIKHKLHDEYDRLVIFNLVRASAHKDEFIGDDSVFQLNTKKDIWDVKTFTRMIVGKNTSTLKKVSEFLDSELKLKTADKLPKEVQTITSLLDYLSNNEDVINTESYLEDPDPECKIFKRFNSHSEFLTETYVDLYKIYNDFLVQVKEFTDISTLQLTKKSAYLKTHSDNVLNQCNGNPKIALDKLTKEYASILEKKDLDYDESAITFFLVDELIRCNVFPNLRTINV